MLAAEGFGQAANLFALALIVDAVGKRGEEGDGKDGLLLIWIHGVFL